MSVKKYVALLSQSETAHPVVNVLENSLGGSVVWERTDTGQYTATLAGAFPRERTVIFANLMLPLSHLYEFAAQVSYEVGSDPDSFGLLMLKWADPLTLREVTDSWSYAAVSITVYPEP